MRACYETCSRCCVKACGEACGERSLNKYKKNLFMHVMMSENLTLAI